MGREDDWLWEKENTWDSLETLRIVYQPEIRLNFPAAAIERTESTLTFCAKPAECGLCRREIGGGHTTEKQQEVMGNCSSLGCPGPAEVAISP